MKSSFIQLFCEMEEQILDKIDQIIEGIQNKEVEKKWIKSSEVCEMLSCPRQLYPGLRADGLLPSSLIQGTYYYKISDIDHMMERGKSINIFKNSDYSGS